MPQRVETLPYRKLHLRLQAKAAKARLPFEAAIELTYACPLRCVHCYNPTHQAKGESSTEEVLSFLRQLADAGTLFVSFTGGELFTRPDWHRLLSEAKALGMRFALITNATLITPAIADKLKALSPYRVDVSLYGATRAGYEAVTRTPGSFARFLSGLRALTDRGLPIRLKAIVLKPNAHEVSAMRSLAESFGLKFDYCAEVFPRVDGSREPLKYRLAPEDAVRLWKELVFDPSAAESRSCAAASNNGPYDCRCGKSAVAITPHGEMNLCISNPLPRYDLKAGTVEEGWKSLVRLVDSTRPTKAYECPHCPVKTHCTRGPGDSQLEMGDVNACVPQFKREAELRRDMLTSGGSHD